VAQAFLTEGPALLAKIRAAAAAGDSGRLWRAAHTLRGAAGVFAATAVQQVAGQIEEAGRAGRVGDGPQAVAELEARLAELLAALGELAQEPPQGPGDR
jgi:HPt (histidine-containing phosphotransfer) domain-containing protein